MWPCIFVALFLFVKTLPKLLLLRNVLFIYCAAVKNHVDTFAYSQISLFPSFRNYCLLHHHHLVMITALDVEVFGLTTYEFASLITCDQTMVAH